MFAHLSPVFVCTKLSTRWRSSVRTWRSKTCPKLLPIKHPPPAFPFSCFSRVDYSLCIRHTLPLFLCNIPPDRRRASAPRATIYFTNRVANSTPRGDFTCEREKEMRSRTFGGPCPPHSPELIGSLKLGNIWIFVQLIFGPRWPMHQLNINPNIA